MNLSHLYSSFLFCLIPFITATKQLILYPSSVLYSSHTTPFKPHCNKVYTLSGAANINNYTKNGSLFSSSYVGRFKRSSKFVVTTTTNMRSRTGCSSIGRDSGYQAETTRAEANNASHENPHTIHLPNLYFICLILLLYSSIVTTILYCISVQLICTTEF